MKLDAAAASPPKDPEHFTGEVAIQSLSAGSRDEPEVLAVWFKHGARTIPHLHPSDQMLVVVKGKCVVATKGKQVILAAGEVALISKGEWHWHGAATSKVAMHISIKMPGKGDWDQPMHDFKNWSLRDSI
jgi:quercetin dioxygenase-like cupin family protein